MVDQTDIQQNTDDTGAQAQAGEAETLKLRIAELENNWKRALADYKNLEKRVNEERYQFLAFANMSLILRMLPILDNLEMLEKHSSDMGLALTIKEFKQILKDEDVFEIDTTEKEFDSTNMEAVEMIEGKANQVLEVVRKGYTCKEKLLRPARVKVGKG